MRPVRVRIHNRESGRTTEHEFVSSPIRLGRNPLNDLSLPYSFVSGWHAVIRFDESTARFFDLGSTNGTLVDGRRIGAGESVGFDGPTLIVIGDLDLTFSRGELATAIAEPAPELAERNGGRRPWMRAPGTQDLRAGSIDTDDRVAALTPRPNQTAHVPLGQVHAILAGLRPVFEELHQARMRYDRELRERIGELPVHLRESAESFIRREFGDDGKTAATPSPRSSGTVAKFSEELAPELPPPASADEEQRFLRRVRDVLEACAKGLVELQNGQEQFGNEMGVRAVKEFTPLHTAASANNVLEYLLDWRHGGAQRVQELVGVFADSMIHQVALINGVVAGSRALLGRLAPEEVERQVQGGWRKNASAKWQAFVARYRELAAGDRALVEALFGREFARAYAEVGGEQAP